MNMGSQLSQQLTQYFTTQMAFSKTLHEILNRERDILLTRDPDEIEKITKEKEAVLKQIHEEDNNRMQLLKKYNFHNDKRGMMLLMQQCENTTQASLEGQWRDLRRSLQECHNQNIANGMIINSAQVNNQILMALLQGKSPNNNSNNAYDKHGKTQNGSNSTGSTRA